MNPTLTNAVSTGTRSDAATFKGTTWGAATQPNWPFNIASRVSGTNTVTVNGQLSVTILTNPTVNPLTVRGSDGMIVMDHEKLHVGIWTNAWGQLSSSVRNIEGTYSSAAAADTAVAAANALARLTYYNGSLENHRMDWDHYGANIPAQQARIIDAMQQAATGRSAAQQELNKLEQTWVNQGYYKTP